jgi:Apea-like HEPN
VSPGLLEALHKLTLNRNANEFKSDLYATFLLHSRHSVVAEIPHKIVFLVAAIESLLIKDNREPIQKNLGERMAFIIGNSLRERKDIVRNVEDFYRVRSAFFHHGRSVKPEETDIVDKFFFNVWFCLGRLLVQADQYETKDKLLAVLEDRKLS